MNRTLARVVTGLSLRLEEGLSPWLDLAIRLWLAQAFLVMDVQAMMLGPAPWLTAPFGASWWLTAVHGIMGSTTGLAVGAVCPLLLAAGLLARPAGLAMLVQTVLIPPAAGSGPGLFWAALLVRLIVVGAGTLSIDTLLRRGLESSAVPVAHRAAQALSALRWRGGPVYLVGLRLWLASAIAGMALAALGVTGAMRPGFVPGLPQVPAMIAGLAPIAALAAAGFLISGFATRPTALALLALVPLGQLAGVADGRLPWALLLGVLLIQGAGSISVDRFVGVRLRRMTPPVDRSGLPHVVVVGGGFGGVAAARGLRGTACRVTVVDLLNHHLFQPLLYQVATASL